jgi:hypothetical protein
MGHTISHEGQLFMKNAGLEVIARTNEQEKCVNPANPKAQTPSLLRFFLRGWHAFFWTPYAGGAEGLRRRKASLLEKQQQ